MSALTRLRARLHKTTEFAVLHSDVLGFQRKVERAIDAGYKQRDAHRTTITALHAAAAAEGTKCNQVEAMVERLETLRDSLGGSA